MATIEENAQERKGIVTFKGTPVTLVGPELSVGDEAPDFTAIGNDLKPVQFSDFRGRTILLSVVPSVDTGICAEQTKKFNDRAKELSAKVVTISLDLPFAQKRFCGANTVEELLTVSDAKDRDFAHKYGLYMKELGLLARAVIVVNKEGKIAYIEIVPEMASHPNYDAALAAVKQADQI